MEEELGNNGEEVKNINLEPDELPTGDLVEEGEVSTPEVFVNDEPANPEMTVEEAQEKPIVANTTESIEL